MSLKIGIVGLPNVGKSTLFKALTKKQVDIANYPFCTIEPNVGVVEVPDERLRKLADLSHSKKIVPTIVEFVDIAGLVKGAAEGQGLGNKFLTHIREVDAIAEVVRVFENKDIIHVHEKTDPIGDIEVIEYELILKDLETVTKRFERIQSDVRARKKEAIEEDAVLQTVKELLESGRRAVLNTEAAQSFGKPLELLTAKPLIYILNLSEEQIQKNWKPDTRLRERMGNSPFVLASAQIESELSELSEEEQKEFLNSLGLTESSLGKVIRTGYETLGLMTFFTTGEDESRAWTVIKNSTAPQAGRAIHSDFEEKFIRAEVVFWQKLLEVGSWSKARDVGLLKTEGKEYIVKDGDVIEFKI